MLWFIATVWCSLALFYFKRLCLRNFDIIRHISVLIGITCFSEHISVNKRLWLMQVTSKKWIKKIGKNMVESRKHPWQTTEIPWKPWVVCCQIWISCMFVSETNAHVFSFFSDNVRKTCTKWLQLNILFLEIAVEGVFTSNITAFPAPPRHEYALYVDVCLLLIHAREWDAFHFLVFWCLFICAYAYTFFLIWLT